MSTENTPSNATASPLRNDANNWKGNVAGVLAVVIILFLLFFWPSIYNSYTAGPKKNDATSKPTAANAATKNSEPANTATEKKDEKTVILPPGSKIDIPAQKVETLTDQRIDDLKEIRQEYVDWLEGQWKAPENTRDPKLEEKHRMKIARIDLEIQKYEKAGKVSHITVDGTELKSFHDEGLRVQNLQLHKDATLIYEPKDVSLARVNMEAQRAKLIGTVRAAAADQILEEVEALKRTQASVEKKLDGAIEQANQPAITRDPRSPAQAN